MKRFPGPRQKSLLALLWQRPRTTGELADAFGIPSGERNNEFCAYSRMQCALRGLRERNVIAHNGKYQPWQVVA